MAHHMALTNYKELTDNLGKYLQELHKGIPEAMQGFGQMHKAANKDGVLSAKTKELLALAIGVALRCDGCIGMHMKALVKMGITREELMETLAVVAYMGGGPALMYAANALRAFAELQA